MCAHCAMAFNMVQAKHPPRSIMLPKFCQHQMQMCKKKRDERDDVGLTGVSSKVRTVNVLIVSIFA